VNFAAALAGARGPVCFEDVNANETVETKEVAAEAACLRAVLY